jgi:hypothetical protein
MGGGGTYHHTRDPIRHISSETERRTTFSMKTGDVPHNMTGIYQDWDMINIWMDRLCTTECHFALHPMGHLSQKSLLS